MLMLGNVDLEKVNLGGQSWNLEVSVKTVHGRYNTTAPCFVSVKKVKIFGHLYGRFFLTPQTHRFDGKVKKYNLAAGV